MKRLLPLLLLIACAGALANGVDNMVAQCEEVMRCGICQVANAPIPHGQTMFVTYTDTHGNLVSERVDTHRYQWYRIPGYAKTKAGKFQMCERVRTAMKKPDSLEARLPRIMFRQDWTGPAYCPPSKP